MKRNLPAILFLIFAAALIVVGIIMNQPGSVLSKAVRICMECIGLG